MRRTSSRRLGPVPAALPVLVSALVAAAGCGGRGAEQPKASVVGGPITSLVFLPDGKTLAGAQHFTIKFWDLDSGQQKQAFDDAGNAFSRIALSADVKRLAAGGYDGRVIDWDIATGKELHRYKGHKSAAVLGLGYTPDGKILMSAAGNANPYFRVMELKLWDADDGKVLADLEGHKHAITAAAFSPDGKRLVSAAMDSSLNVWDVDKRSLVKGVPCGGSWVTAVAFSADGKTLASGMQDGTVRLWDTSAWTDKATFKGHQLSVNGVAFAPDGKTLASAAEDGAVKLWDVASGEARATITPAGIANAVAFSPDGKTLAGGGAAGVVRLWDSGDGKEKATLK